MPGTALLRPPADVIWSVSGCAARIRWLGGTCMSQLCNEAMMGSNARLPFDPVWLFPATYAVHPGRRIFVRGGFHVWAERALGIRLSNGEFVAWNTFAFALICVGAAGEPIPTTPLHRDWHRDRGAWQRYGACRRQPGNMDVFTWTAHEHVRLDPARMAPISDRLSRILPQSPTGRNVYGHFGDDRDSGGAHLESCVIGAAAIGSHVARSPVIERIARTVPQTTVSASVHSLMAVASSGAACISAERWKPGNRPAWIRPVVSGC